MVHQNLTHEPGSDAEKVGAILPGWLVLVNHPYKCFVYQGRWLEGMIATLAVEIPGGQTTKFIVDEWNQFSFSVPVSLPESNQQVRDLTTLRLHADSPASR